MVNDKFKSLFSFPTMFNLVLILSFPYKPFLYYIFFQYGSVLIASISDDYQSQSVGSSAYPGTVILKQ